MTDIDGSVKVDKGDLKNIESRGVGGRGGRGRRVGGGGYGDDRRCGIGGGGRLGGGLGGAVLLFGYLVIVRQLVYIEELGRELQEILLFAAGGVVTGIQAHAEQKIAPADAAFEGIDLYEIIYSEFDIPPDAVELIGVLAE